MAQQTFSVPANARILVRNCTERVSITGWENAQQAITDSLARQDGDTLVIENVRRVNLRVPRTVSVTVSDCEADIRVEDIAGNVELEQIEGDLVLRGLAQVTLRDIEGDIAARGVAAIKGEGTWDGDAAFRGVIGSIAVNAIDGDAALNDVAAVTIETLEGDLALRGLRGPLHLGEVHGDVSLHDVEGDITVARLEGDFIAAGIQGSIDAPEIEGDAVISLADVKGVIVRAEGDAVINLPVNANCEIELDAPHGDVVARGGIRIQERDESHIRGTLGNGGPKVVIESLHDDVIARVGPEGPGGQNFGAEMGREFGDLGRELGREFGALGLEIGEEVRRSVQESLSGINTHHRPHHSHEERQRAQEARERAREQAQELRRRAQEERQRAQDERERARAERQRAREEQNRAREDELQQARLLRQEVPDEPQPADTKMESQVPSVEPKPSGPPAGSPERKAILDAIARGEISVDDAIRKLNGE